MSVELHHPAQDNIINRQNKESTFKGGESSSMPPENKNWLHSKQTKIIAGVATLSILATLGVEGLLNNKSDKATIPTNKAAITDTLNPGNETQKQTVVPEEAKHFISVFGGRFADPVSTYYAEVGYENAHNREGLTLSDDYISGYEMTTNINGNESELGFTRYELPATEKSNQDTVIKVFNEYVVKNLSLYMNLLSKNPSQKAVAVIDNQFLNYCSDTSSKGMPIEFTADNDAIAKLMATAKGIVLKYGSTANYSVGKGSTDSRDVSATTFVDVLGAVEVINFDGQKLESFQAGGTNLTINIDQYDGKKVSHKREVVKDMQLSIIKQPKTGTKDNTTGSNYISIGQR